MAKKPSGLGRGLGDLLEDNAPEIRGGATVIKNEESGAIHITPPPTPQTGIKPKSLYEEKHKNKSLKANFRNFK